MSKLDKIPIDNPELDRRVKLTPDQKKEIRKRWDIHGYRAKKGLLGEVLSQRILAKEYRVSRRTIQFILNPKSLEENKKRREERGGSKIYYKRYGKEKWAKTMKDHREYKNKLYKLGLI